MSAAILSCVIVAATGEEGGKRLRRAGLTVRGLASAYSSIAVICTNTALLALVVLLVAYGLDALLARRASQRDIARDPIPGTGGKVTFADLYPGMSPSDIKTLVSETWSRPFACDPWAQFGERTHAGRFVNVHPAGFRNSTNQAPWPPIGGTNIFMFGGSTLFGYGLSDDQTIASRLGEHLGKAGFSGIGIYNFGRGFYFSTQEMVLLATMLSDARKPDIAIFLDGLNEFLAAENRPLLTPQMEAVFDGERDSLRHAARIVGSQLPLLRFMVPGGHNSLSFSPPLPDPIGDPPAMARHAVERYRRNCRLIEAVARAHAVAALFVWQPIPVYQLDEETHPFGRVDLGESGSAMKAGYALLDPSGGEQASRPAENWLWLGGMQRDISGPTYIDHVHYAPAMADRVAAEIARELVHRQLLLPPARAIP